MTSPGSVDQPDIELETNVSPAQARDLKVTEVSAILALLIDSLCSQL